ncbi:unnamed protein product [Cuscuta campestris]|uniref:DRBM domain-containing protein n=1 Tax=Cuscuta campestris TaxID=132261 RepID=A0A484LF56_9ASTE|nr:unnamed protein product [Cuscuta campestris]
MPTSDNSDNIQGISNCYIFKSRLQEYAQKLGLPTPIYETIKEGPPHGPLFRSTVVVNDVKYDSLPGFFNRKAAEQSAAEVALLELSRSGDNKECISMPVHDTGLCKNILQEYAQKMNYATPLYKCSAVRQATGRHPLFTCTVDIGGVKYIGGASKSKKTAELKAARTALLAIESDPSKPSSVGPTTDHSPSNYTVVPMKKQGVDPTGTSHHETAASFKANGKKSCGTGWLKRKRHRGKRQKHLLPNEGSENHYSTSGANPESGATVLPPGNEVGGEGSRLGLGQANLVESLPCTV